MDRDDDVERLFSWIKTPDLHYREFAGEREVADTAATWPVLRDAVAEPTLDERLEPGTPHEGELLPSERARHGDHPAEVFGHHEEHHEPPPAYHSAETPAPREDESAGDVPWASEPPPPAPTFAQREPPVVARPEPPPRRPVSTERQPEPPPRPVVIQDRPIFTQDRPVPPPPRVQEPPPLDEEYRGFEEAQPAPEPAADPEQAKQTRSLDAIFSRVAHPAPAPREGRRQASGSPGLGPVFRRLR